MLKKQTVEMPAKGIVKQKSGKYTYIYHILRAYRDKKGKPTNDRVAIGKLEETTGRLIPNETYFELYPAELKKEPQKVIQVETKGVTEFCEKAIKNSGLEMLLKNVFPDKYQKLLLVAMYMLSEGNVMNHLESWCEKNATPNNIILKSQMVSKLFESITYDERMRFFKAMSKAKIEDEFVAYDVTSISSYSKNIDSVEWGYNRDKETLPQINLGVYYGEESRMPLFYAKYPGSINDKAHMKYMLQNNEFTDFKNVKFVMDKGFYSKENLQLLNKHFVRYIIAVPTHLKIVKETIQTYRSQIVLKSECKLGVDLPYAKSIVNTDFGARLKMCIYYNPNKASDEIETFLRGLNEYEVALCVGDENEKSKFKKYFEISTDKNTVRSIKRKVELIDDKLQQLGFFVLLTTEHDLSELEILEKYRNKDIVEKNFDNLKNEIHMNRLRCHSDAVCDGKLFVSFLALIIRAYTVNQLKDYMKKSNLSYASLLKELEKIQQITFNDNSIDILPLTKRQREIFELL